MTFLSVLNFMQTATNYKKPLNFILGCPFHSSLIPRLLCQPGNETSSTDSTVELVTSCFPRFLLYGMKAWGGEPVNPDYVVTKFSL